MKKILSHKASRRSEPIDLASPTRSDTFLFENDEADTDTMTIKAEPVSHACLTPTQVYQDISPNTSKKVSLWFRLCKQIASRKKGHLRTRTETIDFKETMSQQDSLPWNSKMLILGLSESGKSTLLKSLKLHLEGPYAPVDRSAFKHIIFSNAVQSMRVVLEAMESLGLPLEDGLNSSNKYHVRTIFMQPAQLEVEQLPSEVVDAIETLYRDSGVRGYLARAGEYQTAE